MGAYLQQILNHLTTASGNLVYHIVLTFSVAWALQTSQAFFRSMAPQRQRMLYGLGLLLALRLALFAAAAAGGQDLLEGNLLPPIDRGLALFSLILIVWLWAFPDPKRQADAATLLLALLALTLLILAVLSWSEGGANLSYNGSWLDTVGEAIMLAVAAGGALLLFQRRPSGWGFGLAMLLTIALGHLAHLFLLSEPGNYSGAVRLAEAVAYPMLVLLAQRYHLPAETAPAEAAPAAQLPVHYDANPQFTRALLALDAENDPGETCRGLAQAAARAVQADICLLAYPPGENGQIAFPCGIDLVQEVDYSPFSIDSGRVPVIASVLHKGLPVTLHASSTSPDLVSLVQALNLDRAGPFIAVPVLGRSAGGVEVILAALVLLSPHSWRSWEKDQEVVMQIAGSMAHLLQRTGVMETLQMEAEEARRSLEAAQAELEAERRERENVLKELTLLEGLYRKEHAELESLTALIKDQEETEQAGEKNGAQATPELEDRDSALAAANQQLAEAQAEIDRLRSLQESAEKTEPVRGEGQIGSEDLAEALLQALDELENMRIALAEAEQHSLTAEQQTEVSMLDDGRLESLAALALDLRLPVAVLFRQVRSLLTGPEDELNEAQRRSLEEIKAATQRAASMVDQLIRMTAGGAGEDADAAGFQPAAQTQPAENQRQADGQLSTDDLPGAGETAG